MQGSSGGAASLLYSAAVTVRFFDAVALALFACELGIVLLGGRIRSEHRSKTCVAHRLGSLCSRNERASGSDFRLADKTAV